MDRPTKEQVDGMLGVDVYDCDGSTAKAIAENLQAEVRALREVVTDQANALDVLAAAEIECDKLRDQAKLFSDAHEAAEKRIVELRATIARVEALCDEADKRGAPYAIPLRKALRGET